jgi:uncharacterized protein DUF6011
MSTTTITGVKCGNHGLERVYHENAAAVRACFQQPTRAKLDEDERQMDAMVQDAEREEERRVAAYKAQRDELYPGTTPSTAHRQFVKLDELRGVVDAPVTQDGMYRSPQTGEIFKVQWNRGSGDGRRLYAKQLIMWVLDGHHALREIPLEGSKVEGVSSEFQYAPGAMRFIRPDWRMTMEEAKAFGALYGTCVRCGRTLTLEESIERAMGRVCASKI